MKDKSHFRVLDRIYYGENYIEITGPTNPQQGDATMTIKQINHKFSTVNFRMDSAGAASEEQIVALLEAGVTGKLGSRPSHHVHVNDEGVSIFGAGPYFLGSEDGDGGLVLTASDEPGDWLCWFVENLDVAVYGPGMRVVDFVWRIVPLHDSHARFARAVYEMTARVE